MNQVDHFMSKLMSNLDGSKDAKIAVLVGALEKVRSYNVDIAAGRINYRPQDHIEVIDRALSSSNGE